MEIAPGATVTLKDVDEGWFPLAPAEGLRGSIVRVLTAPDRTLRYVVELDTPLEVQEPATDTPSALRLHVYRSLVIGARLTGVAIGSEQNVPVYVCLVPQNSEPPSTIERCAGLPIRVWASCAIDRERARPNLTGPGNMAR